MSKCKFENQIDNYLLNRLSEENRENFEEHYFNCSHCFEKITERDEIISVIKNRGDEIFQDAYAPEFTKKANLADTIFGFFTPTQWAVAAVSAALVLIVAIGILPRFKSSAPEFFVNEDLVRGSSVVLISPVIDTIGEIPSQFKWQSLGDDVEYKIYIYNNKLLWSASTKDSYIILPDEVKDQMISGQKYSWQVKAFSREGSLIAVSSRVQFRLSSAQ
jgi:hypothetical protein